MQLHLMNILLIYVTIFAHLWDIFEKWQREPSVGPGVYISRDFSIDVPAPSRLSYLALESWRTQTVN